MNKLFVYRNLSPEKSNKDLLNHLNGTWEKGFIWGKLYVDVLDVIPKRLGVRFDHNHEKIKGYLFSSKELKNYWNKLDILEGEAYECIKVTVFIDDGKKDIKANIYVLK
ncbi:hypothetical protein [uncultured Flavobacterium sp.]|uniref:hypothetical protein n=1 Tax=uncultured Flavobacterium sp. TaxID=165435 RepID=UPI0030CA4407